MLLHLTLAMHRFPVWDVNADCPLSVFLPRSSKQDMSVAPTVIVCLRSHSDRRSLLSVIHYSFVTHGALWLTANLSASKNIF